VKVRAINTCWVDKGLRVKGSEFEYSGPPNRHLEPLTGGWPVAVEAPAAEPLAEPKPRRKKAPAKPIADEFG
jgi:hypothetical protein